MNDDNRSLAGLLAHVLAGLPSRPWAHEQWYGVLPGDFQPQAKVAGGLMGIYSYGDSAGISPDFPFNDAGRQP